MNYDFKKTYCSPEKNHVFGYLSIFLAIVFFSLTFAKAEETKMISNPAEVAQTINNAIPLVAYGIVNPFGPTLMGFSVNPTSDGEGQIVFYSLNPFSQQIEFVSKGVFEIDEMKAHAPFRQLELQQSICEFLRKREEVSFASGTPSFLFYHWELYEKSDIVIQELINIAVCIVKYSSGQLKSLKDFKKYPLDVWSRVQKEVEKSVGKLPKLLIEGDIPTIENRADNITNEQIYEIIQIIGSSDHIKEEFKGFFYAWDGAIDFQRTNNNLALVENSVNLGELTNFVTPLLPSISQFVE